MSGSRMKRSVPEQTVLSSYFSPGSTPNKRLKHDSGVVDLTVSGSDEERESHLISQHGKQKNLATSRQHFFSRRSNSPSSSNSIFSQTPSKLEKYRLDYPITPTRASSTESASAQSTTQTGQSRYKELQSSTSRRGAYREAFRRKLLGDGISFDRSSLSELTAPSAEAATEVSDSELRESSKGPEIRQSIQQLSHAHGQAKLSKLKDDIGPSGQSYTALEQQVLRLKRQHREILLMIEVGYKYRFFGEDARVASKELGVVCFQDRNFLTAGIPTHRKEIHLKKLLSQGYKVGIVGQTETAALKKVSDNRNAPFERQLTQLFTASTYVDNLDSLDDPSTSVPSLAPSLLCLAENFQDASKDGRIRISLVSVTPSTGDVVWDEFEDGFMRGELESRLAHINPAEIIIPRQLSNITESMLSTFISISSREKRIRIERIEGHADYSAAVATLSGFYGDKGRYSENCTPGKLLASAIELPKSVCISLADAVKYLSMFGLAEVLTRVEFFLKFTEKTHMLLNANTLANLEIYHNQTDYTEKGSLVWILDKTQTNFGSRMLRSWIGRPLVDMQAIQDRTRAVEEVLTVDSVQCREILVKLRGLLKGLPDLARGLSRIQYGKCTPKELATLITTFHKLGQAFPTVTNMTSVGFKSSILNKVVHILPTLVKPVASILSDLNTRKATEGKISELWNDPEKYPSVLEAQLCILTIESELQDHLKSIRKVIQKPAVQWTSVAGEEYLIEIRKDERRTIPLDWVIVSSTKSARRYHTPEVRLKLQERAQYQETLDAEARRAYLSFLEDIAKDHYGIFRNAVHQLAVLDCLLSMANVASRNDYAKPNFTNDNSLVIEEGRHPMIEALRSDPVVPNTIFMDTHTCKIITGPNMGGKSSTVRMVALIALMAQIGSYVPARSVNISLFDAILTRMGASDDIIRGKSTFMVEMSETSDVLRLATSRSLVILDELGRGTSTYDGMALAGAVLEHIVRHVHCKTLFITHYDNVATRMEQQFPSSIQNLRMSFTEYTGIDGIRTITFLYKIEAGLSPGSFGVECARLAGLPSSVLNVASKRSRLMQDEVRRKQLIHRATKCGSILRQLNGNSVECRVNMRDLSRIIADIQKELL